MEYAGAMESARLEFLWKAMTLLPRNDESCNILRCHFMSACRSLDGHGDAQLPTKYTQKSAMCQYCSNIWKNGMYSTKMLPERIQPKSIKKIISRYNKDPSCLRKFEVGLARKYARRKNILVTTCGICCKETKIDLFKPEAKVKLEIKPFVEEPKTEKKKKKRYSRDRTAGLRIPTDFHAQEKLDQKYENPPIYQNTNESDIESPSVSHVFSEKGKRIVENKKSVCANEFMISKINKKKRKLLEDTAELSNIKNYCRPKIMKKQDNSSQKSALNKLVKSNKMGNIFSNAGPSSESPLSKFLSSL